MIDPTKTNQDEDSEPCVGCDDETRTTYAREAAIERRLDEAMEDLHNRSGNRSTDWDDSAY